MTNIEIAKYLSTKALEWTCYGVIFGCIAAFYAVTP